jgi:hypothetical protein
MLIQILVLLFFFWYCHKRGKEVRLEKEKGVVDGEGRITELDDDPMIEAFGSHTPLEGGDGAGAGEGRNERPKRKEVSKDHSEAAKSTAVDAQK